MLNIFLLLLYDYASFFGQTKGNLRDQDYAKRTRRCRRFKDGRQNIAGV